ncbi:MAG: hypothetical protein AAGI91_02795 [Bacteroidota bacterium]
METQEIIIRVSPEAARLYESASEQDRRRMDLLISLQLTGKTTPEASLEDIMRRMSREAQQNGLTPELLAEILSE